MTYNEAQLQAIQHVEGPMIALAGPGSGKTTVITERVRYLIEEAGIDPMHILVITFTRAAATEMKTRFTRKMQGANAACTFGTFHSVFFMILKMAYGFSSDNVLTEDVKYQMIRDIIRKMELEYEDEDDFIHGVMGEISEIKSELFDIDNYYSKNTAEAVFRSIYKAYETRRRAMKKVDFDDMLVYCYELFKERPDILAKWQNRYHYILIDEFQDINLIQYQIVKMLAAPRNNLFIVGDDDQSVYRFRGAKPEIMLGFEKDYIDAKRVTLNVNYRCSKDICESAGRLIQNNATRFPKVIEAYGEYETPVYIHRVKTRREENLHILSRIQEYQKQGIPLSSMAVLYRTNVQPRAISELLMGYNIPFQMRDTVPSLYQHFAVQNVMTYIKIALGDNRRQSYLQIINKPKRYISRDAFLNERVDIEELIDFYDDKRWAIDNLIQLSNDLHVLPRMTPYAAIQFVRNAIGYDAYLEEYAEYRHLRVDDLYQILDEMAELAKPYRTYDEWFDAIEQYEEQLAKQKQEAEKNKSGVVLATMHSAKGLEFDAVFVLEANEGVSPHKKSTQPEEIEEERRMFYVAMTRAKHFLHIYSVSELFGKPVEPSRFLAEILKETK